MPGGGSGPSCGVSAFAASKSPSVIGVSVNVSGTLTVGLRQSIEKIGMPGACAEAMRGTSRETKTAIGKRCMTGLSWFLASA
jgi:hypothetical protein